MVKKISKFLIVAIILVIAGIWLSSGFYTVKSGEEAVVLKFGKHVGTVSKAGLNWHLPAPFESVIKVNVLEVKRLEFGYKTIKEGGRGADSDYADIAPALMLTGDENLVNVEAAIQYKIKEIDDYVFGVKSHDETLQIAAESAIRRVIANHILDEVLTENKYIIQQEIKEDLQKTCNDYKLGIGIIAVQLQDVNPPDEVDAAFKDVANAREDRNSYINEAESYKNEVIPKARGNAAKMVNDALAYKEKRIAEAKGDVANFAQILEKYEQGKDVTRIRMYLETMEEVLPGIDKYIVDSQGNLIKFLPLEQSQTLQNGSKQEKGGSN
ncbi:MAG TPA: FtsH protease activity modulator HflK [Clostridiales bacterium]|nr:FtsH protease activity modulator HflK [Clostridiales bacterium]